MKKTMFSGLLVILTVGLLFAAGQKEESTVSGPGYPEEVTLRYMTWEGGDWQTFSEKFIEKYMKDNPHVNIQYEPTAGSEYMTKLKVSISAGTAPDVVWVDNWLELLPRGVFEPLDEYAKKFNFPLSEQNQEILEMCSYNGKIYGLCGWTGITGIYYNKELFDKAGVEYPKEGWTWDDVTDMAKKITKGEGADKIYGISLQLDWNGAIEPMMWGNGSRMIDDNLNYDGVMNSDKAAEAVAWYTSFTKEGLAPRLSALKSMGGTDEMFKAGKTGMVYSFSGNVKGLRESGFDMNKVGVIQLPVGSSGSKPAATVLFTNPICVSKDSKNKDEACKFLFARVGEEIQEEFTSMGWTMPAMPKLVDKMNLADDPHLAYFGEVLTKPEKYVFPKPTWWCSPVSSLISENLVNVLTKVIIDNEDPKKALDEAVETIKKAELKQK